MKQCIAVCVLMLYTWWSVADEGKLAFKHFHSAEGLSQSAVIAIAQDDFGMMWFGTRDGLNRYDGRSFQVFRTNPTDSTSLSNNDILEIKVDAKGDLWIGTYNGLNHYIQRSERFERYLASDAGENVLSNHTIRTLEVVSEDQIWVGTQEGLNIINPKTHEIRTIRHDTNRSNSLAGDYILDIYQDSRGAVWIATSNGLCVTRNPEATLLIFEDVPLGDSADLQTSFVQEVLEDPKGNMWVGTRDWGLFLVDPDGQTVAHYDTNTTPAMVHDNIRSLEYGLDGSLWIGTYTGLNRLMPNGEMIASLVDPRDQDGLSENKIKKVYCSDNGAVWVGTYFGGLNMWHEVNFNFNNLSQEPDGGGLSNNVVSAVLQDDETYYLGTEGGGLNIYNRSRGTFDYVSSSDGAIPSSNVKYLNWETKGERIWICTFDAGIVLWDLRNKKQVLRLSTKEGLSHNSVYDVVQDQVGHWVIGTFGGGLNLYDPVSGDLRWIQQQEDRAMGLSDNQVRSLMVDRTGNLWIATQNGLNLSTADAENPYESFQHYFYDEALENGQDVLFIEQSRDGTIWTATKEQGLYRMVDGAFQFVDIFGEVPNSSQIIHAIEEDAKGYFWVSSNNGIARFDPNTEEIKLFTESDGLNSNEYNNKSSLASEEGLMFFGSPRGVTWFDPSQLKSNPFTTQVVLSQLTVNNSQIVPNDSTNILAQTLALTEAIALDYDQSNFSIDFALPSYVNSKKNQFQYRLKGLESEWRQSMIPSVSYAIQNPGDYLFQIRGANNDGLWSDQWTELQIKVHPAPWRSVWAFVIYGFAIAVALLVLFRSIRSRTQLQYELDLELELHKKEQELTTSKLQFFTNISHEFRTPLTLILGPLEQILRDYQGSSAIYKQMKTMQHNASQLLKLINQLMDFRKMENKQAPLETAEGNLVKFVREIYLSFKTYARNGKYSYDFLSEEEEVLVFFDRDKLERVMYNLLSNAFKYTQENGTIRVEVHRRGTEVEIRVIDTGQGIPAETQDKIFDRFFQLPMDTAQSESQRGTGIGLALTKSIVDLHQGKVTVTSQVGQGSTFSVWLPLGSDHLLPNQVISNFKGSDALENYQPEVVTDWSEVIQNAVIQPKNADAKTVLVVEDNSDVRRFIIDILSAEYNIVEAENGKLGLRVAIREVPDLIISDVMMPEMDGIEFCTQVKANLKTSHTPFILLTARTSLIFKYEGLESGADEYINKPFNTKELQLKVRNLLRFVDNLKDRFQSNAEIAPSELTISSVDEEMLQRAIEIVDQNIDNQFFDVSLFCTELGVSRTMLFTKVKAWTNLTPNEFIHSMRMKRAANLLEQGKITVSQISFKVGFKNPKYFSKCFQKYHGSTPSQYADKFNTPPESKT
ncbi:Signal transduction histidine kinase [Reichenbachiella agariperforans]|uniref:histidine kinase n=1 Tax=Reichenbachiella agariperforans TaxID=156994 RepID=A0A1M6QDV2_REIAG|nr:two-component regulator propeller domain-containing protein [Reichenbachiella agariperforans]SHK18243.1 Signal transduction histidine kinase [Reichenbachiella agariperforans]